MTTWGAPRFERYQFAGKRPRAVSADSGISFSDLEHMHIKHRERMQERRLPTPTWAVRDEWLRMLLVIYLEKRFYINIPDTSLSLAERLALARAAAVSQKSRKEQDRDDWIRDYHVISQRGFSDMTDDEVVATFVSLKQIAGQLPLSPDVARDFLAATKLRTLAIEIQNLDTDIVLTEKGHAQVILAVVYQFYRLGWDSVTIAENLGLKSPHVRQVLSRLHETWNQNLSHLERRSEGGSSIKNPSSDLGPSGVAPSSAPLDALFEAAARA